MTEEQKTAASFLWQQDGPQALQLVAGAGSGKTTTLVESVKQCSLHFCPPGQICLLTFTRKAAREMQHRLQSQGLQVGFCGTMHSLAYSLLRQWQKKPAKILLHAEKQQSLLLRQLYPAYSHIPARVLLKENILSEPEKENFEQQYRQWKSENSLCDFDDLVRQATLFLQENEQSAPYAALLVDEFQDTSPDQLEFLKALRAKKLFAVGDDWQSIYSFRGAQVEISLHFARHFSPASRLFLTRNFRSRKNIVALGNRAIALSSSYIRKKLRAHHGRGEKIITFIPRNFSSHRETIGRYLQWQKNRKEESKPVILVRTNELRRNLELALPEYTVMTVHAAKGLEFDHVLVYGIAHHVFPHRSAGFDEETRLFYVAITRARYRLEFLAWDSQSNFSAFMPFLMRQSKIVYL